MFSSSAVVQPLSEGLFENLPDSVRVNCSKLLLKLLIGDDSRMGLSMPWQILTLDGLSGSSWDSLSGSFNGRSTGYSTAPSLITSGCSSFGSSKLLLCMCNVSC